MNIAQPVNVPLLDLDLLNTLVAIAETGNFSSAAERVFRSPSAVSMQVKRMEELLGRPVFKRDSRSVTLTDDGEMLLVHARRVLALNRQMIAKFITPKINGTVRLGALDHATEQFLPTVLKRFGETHPGITVDVVVDDSVQMAKMIAKNQLDIAIVTCGNEELLDKNIEPLYQEALVWAGLKGGIAAEQDPLPISVWEEGCIWRRIALSGLESTGRNYRIALKSAHIAGQKAGIMADLVIAPLPVSSCEGAIIALGKEFGLPPLPDYTLGLIIANDASAPVKAAADNLRASLADLG